MENRTQLSVILSNKPGELAKLCDTLKSEKINILAMSIQNVKDAVKELYRIREKTGRRVTLDASYQGILKDSSDYSMIRLMVDNPVAAEEVLIQSKHLVDSDPVLVFRLENRPGMLGRVAKRFGESEINIDYIYGSAVGEGQESIFVVHIAEADYARLGHTFDNL
jgi:hypothetical protein